MTKSLIATQHSTTATTAKAPEVGTNFIDYNQSAHCKHCLENCGADKAFVISKTQMKIHTGEKKRFQQKQNCCIFFVNNSTEIEIL